MSRDRNAGSFRQNFSIQPSRNVIVGLARGVALVVAKFTGVRHYLNCRKGYWPISQVNNANRQLSAGNKTLNHYLITVGKSIDHGFRKALRVGNLRATLRRPTFGRLHYYWETKFSPNHREHRLSIQFSKA